MQVVMQAPNFGQIFDDRGVRKLTATAARMTRDKIHAWYRSKPEDYFDGPYHPDGTARRFMQPLSSQWGYEVEGGGLLSVFNVYFQSPGGGVWGLRLHQYGKTITPKRAKYLTIPVDPRARNVPPRTFPLKLFYVRRKNPTNPNYEGALVWKDKQGALHAAYALRRSVKVDPLIKRRGHPAVPADAELREMSRSAYETALNEALNDTDFVNKHFKK